MQMFWIAHATIDLQEVRFWKTFPFRISQSHYSTACCQLCRGCICVASADRSTCSCGRWSRPASSTDSTPRRWNWRSGFGAPGCPCQSLGQRSKRARSSLVSWAKESPCHRHVNPSAPRRYRGECQRCTSHPGCVASTSPILSRTAERSKGILSQGLFCSWALWRRSWKHRMFDLHGWNECWRWCPLFAVWSITIVWTKVRLSSTCLSLKVFGEVVADKSRSLSYLQM